MVFSKNFLRSVFTLLIFNDLQAQEPVSPPAARYRLEGISIEVAGHFGTILRHTPKLTSQTGQAVWGQEIGLRFQTFGRHEWHQLQHFPVFGLSLCHFRLGEGAHGDATGFVPTLTVPVFRREKWQVNFRIGTGIGYVSTPYDYFGNPSQNAIGTHWNNITQFRLGAEARLTPKLRLLAGGSFTHFSNGSASLPNYGVNMPTAYLALAASPRREPVLTKKTVARRPEKRLGGLLHVGAAYVEYIIWDGPRHPVWIASGAATWHLNRVNRAHLGMDWEFNRSVYAWGLHAVAWHTEAEARRAATRVAVFLGDEFLFGHLGVQLQTGFYVGNRMNQYVLNRFYNKLAIRAYLPRLFGTGLRPHVGIYLKAHRAIAEYISLNAGVDF